MGEAPSEFAQQLRSLRQAHGLTVRALAHLIGVSKVTIWKWEKGDTLPRARMIGPLARALRVAPDQLRYSAEAPGEDVPSTDQPAGAIDPNQSEVLSDVIATAKQMIAEASGASPQNITISIEY